MIRVFATLLDHSKPTIGGVPPAFEIGQLVLVGLPEPTPGEIDWTRSGWVPTNQLFPPVLTPLFILSPVVRRGTAVGDEGSELDYAVHADGSVTVTAERVRR